jgi:peptidyl-prolyl cis-trans isomerase D
MAAIGKIRSWGPILVTVIGLALFAFIAGDLAKSCESMKNQDRSQIGEVLGKKIDYQEYQKLFDEYQDVIKMTQGRDNLSDAESNQVKDMVWNQYVQSAIIADEAEKLGITVTDKELQDIFNQGTNPMLMQTPFVNQQTGRFDVNSLKRFIAEYKSAQSKGAVSEESTALFNYWTFLEKNIRQQLLAQKYQTLFSSCLISNPVAAKAAFDAENEESSLQLASFPYTSINDNKVEISEQDLKAKYEELKPRFRQLDESRDIKYVDVQVMPSDADRAALEKTMKEYALQLVAATDPSEIVRKSASSVSYNGLPQTRTAFPLDIAGKLDSMAVGSVSPLTENKQDNTFNLVKLIAKQQLPDSIEFRTIQVVDADVNVARKRADSIYTALQAGADFEALAKKYGQDGAKNWLTSQQYKSMPTIDKDTRSYLETLTTSDVNALKNVEMAQANIIVQVTARKAMVTKYTAAVIKKKIDFSRDTYNTAFNKFSQFVSESKTIDDMQNNAKKYGYTVLDRAGVRNTEHYVANVPATRDALKWIFEAKKGSVSQLYECGGNNDHLMVVALSGINEKGFLPMSNEQVNNYLRSEVMRDKKAAQLMEKAKAVKDIAQATKAGATVSDVDQLTFASAFVQATGAQEPALAGAVSRTKAGAMGSAPVKGNAGVYVYKVKSKALRQGVKYDEKAYEKQAKQRAMQMAGNYMQQLYQNAKVVDNRYLFF